MRVDDIVPYEKNAKKHDDRQVTQIANSLKRFGWQQPIVIDKDNVVVIGHGRLMAAKRLGMAEVPVTMADKLSKKEIKALRLADNKLNESPWDDDLLNLDLDDIGLDIDMADFGFDEALGGDGSEYGTDFSLPDGEKSEFCVMTFTFHEKQRELIEAAINLVGDVTETFGNTNRHGNALYEVVKQWDELRKSN